jgi:hypothetical protein
MFKNIIICLLCFLSAPCFAQQVVDVDMLLHEMISYKAVASWPHPFYKEHQASSYDRKSVSPDKPGWFANADASQYIRTDDIAGRKENVMLDTDGPGAVVRFWLTTFKRNGILRIYFDNNANPEIIIPAYDLMQSNLKVGPALLAPHSSYEPKQKGGSTLYLPMPFAKHCKITWEDKDTSSQPRYYQINYRKYMAGTVVKTFTLKQLKNIGPLLNEVNDKLLHPDTLAVGRQLHLNEIVEPQKEVKLKLPNGSAAIKFISMTIVDPANGNDEQMLRSAIIKISFDGQQTVWCPVSDFLGSGYGAKQIHSWYRDVNKNCEMISRWVMPYKNAAEIAVLNLGSAKIKVKLTAVTDKWQWNNLSMYFHADWRSEKNVPVKSSEEYKPIEWNFNTIKGKGIFMGDTFAVYNHMHTWYGEGDQKLWVDNASFPDEYGTGTEDYYNTSWAPVVIYQTPFANAPRADNADSFGDNTFTRTRILDAVPFTTAFKYNLEMVGWKNGTIDIAATTYWYGFKNAVSKGQKITNGLH